MTDLLSVDIFQLTHSNHSLRLYCMYSWNSKDDGGVVRINRFVTGDISNRQFITSRYNDIEDVAFLVSCQVNMLMVVCCGEKVDDRLCVCTGGIIEVKVLQVSNQQELAGCKCEVFEEIGKLLQKYWNVWRLCFGLYIVTIRNSSRPTLNKQLRYSIEV